MLPLTLVLIIVGEALAEIRIFDRCPIYPPLTNFNQDWFLGKWYELAKYNKNPDTMSRCVTVNYESVKGGLIEITNTQTPLKGGKPFSFKRTATPVSKPSNGQYNLSTGAPYNVLATDYTNWAIVWSCTYSNKISTRFARIMSRVQIPAGPVNQQAYSAAENFHLEVYDFIPAIEAGCPTS